MAITALLTRDAALQASLQGAVGGGHRIAATYNWDSLIRLVRERPVTAAALDESALPAERPPEDAIADIEARFPNLGIIVLSNREADPTRLFRLGRAGILNLVLLGVDDLSRALPRALQRAAERSATARVVRAMVPYLPRRELDSVRVAMEGIHNRWSADSFAAEVGLSRAFLSERLKACCLPPVGHLLIWVRLFHAGFWLEEPGRTGQSVSRQLEYSSGAAFRRALKLYTGATPSEVTEHGGLSFVLDRFINTCGFGRGGPDASAA
jgi:AraC-like DNA-binding protein